MNQIIKLSPYFWLAQACLVFTISGLGSVPQIVGVSLFLINITKLFVNNKYYNVIYSILLVTYSICFLVIIGILTIFFNQNILFFPIVILNFFISIKTYLYYDKYFFEIKH